MKDVRFSNDELGNKTNSELCFRERTETEDLDLSSIFVKTVTSALRKKSDRRIFGLEHHDPGMLRASSMDKRTILYCLLADLSVPMFNYTGTLDPGMFKNN